MWQCERVTSGSWHVLDYVRACVDDSLDTLKPLYLEVFVAVLVVLRNVKLLCASIANVLRA